MADERKLGRTVNTAAGRAAPAPRTGASATRQTRSVASTPSASSTPMASRVVMPRTVAFEQRQSVPKMRVGPGRQRTLRVESRPLPKPLRIKLPRLSLRLGEMTPARVASLLLIATCIALVAFFLGADGFYVYSATIDGNRLVSQQDIYARSGLDGKNIFAVRTGEAEQRLRDVPFVKNAQVRLGLPAAVTITVEERAPVALWQVAGNTYGVAEDGTILPPDGAPSTAPVVQAEGNALQLGAKIDARLVTIARHVRDLIPDAKSVMYSNERGVGVVTAAGWPVYFGKQDEAMAGRVAVLNSLTAELKDQKVEPELIDLSLSGRPYYRLKSANR